MSSNHKQIPATSTTADIISTTSYTGEKSQLLDTLKVVFGIGVETEFLLEPRKRELDGRTLREVSIKAAASYNLFLSTQGQESSHPAMHNAMDQSYRGAKFAEWSLDLDSTIETPNKDKAPCELI
ncbi:hypothetical protein ACHAP4_010384 [Fusarium culmorum]